MEYFSSCYHVISSAVVFISGFFLTLQVGKYFSLSPAQITVAYLWHTVLCFVYLVYAINFGADAIDYYHYGEKGWWDFSLGTSAIWVIASILISGIGLSIVGAFLVFNIIGSIGLLAFFGAINHATYGKSQVIKSVGTLIIFLPSVSFWSSALGKDPISFMATGLALWASLDLNRRKLLIFIAVISMLLVRPHIAVIMLAALAISIAFDSKISLIKKSLLAVIVISSIFAMVPFVMEYVGLIGLINLQTIGEYIEQRQSYNMDGGGGLDISTMSLPMRIFTYLFRPMIFEAINLFAFAAAIDNMILLIVCGFGFCSILLRRKYSVNGNVIFMWLYILGSCLILATTTANLGIALRQKWMLMPMLLLLMLSVIGKRRLFTIKLKQVETN